MKKNNHNFVIVFLILLILGFFVLYYFLYAHMMATGQEVFNLKAALQVQAKQQQEMNSIANSQTALNSEMTALDSHFIAPDGEVAVIEEIENTGKTLAVTTSVDSVAIENSKYLTTKNLEYLTLRLNAKGSWSNVYRFLSFLSALPYQITIDQADIVLVSDGTKIAAPVWSGTFALKVLEKSK